VPLPDPAPGLVIRYGYLWFDQHRRGQEEGSKDRPCVIVLSVTREEDDTVVTVAPITHTPPRSTNEAVEIPPATKRRLGLDEDRSWIVVSEVNRFRWPGPDVRQVSPARPGVYDFGFLPPALFKVVKTRLLAFARNSALKTAPR